MRDVFLTSHAHAELTIEKLVEALQPTRDMSRNPLFQVMFQLRNAPTQPCQLPDLQVEELDFDCGFTKVDLSLDIAEQILNRQAHRPH